MKVVFIGPDAEVADKTGLSIRLRWPNVKSVVATTAEGGCEAVRQSKPDVIVVQADLPDIQLSQALQNLRDLSNASILVLGNQATKGEAITALEMGADDYVRMPFEMAELMARVGVQLRRNSTDSDRDGKRQIRSGELLINPVTFEVFLGNRDVGLTITEFRMLYLLANHGGRVVAYSEFERSLWSGDVDSYGLATKCVQRLRKKLGDTVENPSWIASVHGLGYVFVGPRPESQTAGERHPGQSSHTNSGPNRPTSTTE